MFSKRTQWKLNTNAISTKFKALKNAGVSILDLTESNPTRCNFSYPAEILGCMAREGNLHYEPEPEGIQKAREAVSAYYQQQCISIEPDRILLTASTSEAYSFLFRLLSNPHDNVIFPQPSYPLFEFLVQLNDIELRNYPLVLEDIWRLDADMLEAAVDSNTRALVCVNPNNPTGNYIKAGELEEINRICRERILALVCDEVFWDYHLGAQAGPASLAGNKGNLTFVLGGLSKCLGLPQMKVSWIAVNGPDRQVEEAMGRLSVIADTYLSVNTPAQNALPVWFSHRSGIQAQITGRLLKNKKFLDSTCSDESIRVLPVEGGWYAVLLLNKGIDEEQFVCDLLDEDHVFIHPGYFFDFTCEPAFVVSLLCEELHFKEGIKRLAGRLKGSLT